MTRTIGQVFGLTVRSRSLGGNIAAAFKSLVGGEIRSYVKLNEDARRQAVDRMVENATAMGANAICMMRFDSTEMARRFGETVAVDRLSFSGAPGRIVGFLGPNGAGKTTTMRALLGLVCPTAGSATIEGRPYAALAQPAHTVGALLDGNDLHAGRSGRNHLRVLARAAAGLCPDPRHRRRRRRAPI